MKLVIFTPVTKTSAIGRMACLVTNALVAHGHEVTVVRTENEGLLDTPTHDFDADLIRWNDFNKVMSIANMADTLVYQIGNSYEFHQGCMEWLPRLPGLVCLHDFFLCHLFYGWAQTHRQQASAVLNIWYGDEVAGRFFCHNTSEEFIEDTRSTSPMTEWACSMAYGVITHSNWGIGRVLNSCPGPVYVVPLAYDASPIRLNAPPNVYADSNEFLILSVGNINPNKRVASVIRAIGNSCLLRQRAVYRLVGLIQPEMQLLLSALAEECQVNLVISGEVDGSTLACAFQQADAVCCLRWPTLEAASASVIEALLYGKPTIVTDAGFCRELPNSCVIKIDPGNEINALQTALESLCKDMNERHALGARAQQWAKLTFTSENYSENLIDMALAVGQTKPVLATVQYFTNLMGKWAATEDLIEDIIGPLRIFEKTNIGQHQQNVG